MVLIQYPVSVLSQYQQIMVDQISKKAYPVTKGKDWHWIWKRNFFLELEMFTYENSSESVLVLEKEKK